MPAFPVYLLHGTDDNVIPAIESVLLAGTLRDARRAGPAARDAADHPRRGRSVGRRARVRVALVRFWAGVLDEE